MEFYRKNREELLKKINDNSAVVMFSGEVYPKTGDQSFPFAVNRNFYYLTGINQENVILVMVKSNKEAKEYLFIAESDPLKAKWVGSSISKDDARMISGINEIKYLKSFSGFIHNLFNYSRKGEVKTWSLYLDLERNAYFKHPYPGLAFSLDFKKEYPEIAILNVYPYVVEMRMCKKEEEIEKIKESINATKIGLDNIMRKLSSGMYEYQLAGLFACSVKSSGNKDLAFDTIAAAGKNATVLHYEKNVARIKDGDLILFDLGCTTDNYASDITRVYPVSGKFTPRQKEIYQEVLSCNKKCIAFLKPGLTWGEYNNYANHLLAESLIKLGKIKSIDELDKYYWHSIGHSLGLNTHDPVLYAHKFKPGMVMTVEPGLYLEDEGIGIRIEDDVLITDTGALCLSKDIIKETDEIEAFMKKSL